MAEAIEVHITAPDVERAAEMARTLVSEGLCACVNIVKEVRSIYVYEGRIHDEPVVLCVAKTRQELFSKLEARVRELHPYDVPEILAFTVQEGSAAYLEWLRGATKG